MDSNASSKDPLSKPSPSDGAPTAIPGMVGNCNSRKGISMAVVDANAVIEGGQSLTNLADKLVTVPQVLTEIRDPDSRPRLDFIRIEPMEPSLESLSKVDKFAKATGDFPSLSDVDRKLIALTYTLEALVHGTTNLRDVPPPIQTVRVKRLPGKELPGWGSNEKETEEISNSGDVIVDTTHPQKLSSVACITGDCAMQNVILQMGLRLLGPDGMQIRRLRRWIRKCHACYTLIPQASFTLNSDIRAGFCPKCGNDGILGKISVTIDKNGTTEDVPFSIPMPKGGIRKNMILLEDQLPLKLLNPITKKMFIYL